jgi:6,7-dimethyl-8-ribityllumazine synthase
MKEKRGSRVVAAHSCAAAAFSRALILAIHFDEDTMNQIPASQASNGSSPRAPAARRHKRVAVISSAWHRDIVDKARGALIAEFERNGLPSSQVEQFEVPGAFEIPLYAKKLARSARYDAIIACGLVVNGGIYRHEFVASAVIDGLMRVQVESEVPVLSAVLTPRDFHEHEDHVRFFSEHFVKKGTEVAQACLQTMAMHQALLAGAAHQANQPVHSVAA